MSYTSLIQHFKRMAEGYLPEEPYYCEMHPTPGIPLPHKFGPIAQTRTQTRVHKNLLKTLSIPKVLYVSHFIKPRPTA
jgi:hypothetical protein